MRRQEQQRSANLAFACALFAPDEDKELDWLPLARRAATIGHYYALAKLGERRWRDGELNHLA